MSDFAEIDVFGLYQEAIGEEGTGRLRLFQVQNYQDNPYAEPASAPETTLDVEAVAIRLMPVGRGGDRTEVGAAEDKTYRCTIRPPDNLDALQLQAYALLEFRGMRVTGVLDRVDRKVSSRFHIYIDSSKNFPLELENETL
jgi:hypothetical protein